MYRKRKCAASYPEFSISCCKGNRKNNICYYKSSRKDDSTLYYHGGILIEFAFSIPILISLLFFINDHYRFYELQNKVKSSAYLVASIIQQIGNTRTDKQLTKYDFGRIAYASGLNFFHTGAMFTPYPFGIYYAVCFFWVKRINENSYQYQKSHGTTSSAGTSPAEINQNCSRLQTKTKKEITEMHHDLICDNDGDEKLLIEVSYRKNSRYYNRNKLGFFILEPKIQSSLDGINNSFFKCILIITPKPGLFPAKVE